MRQYENNGVLFRAHLYVPSYILTVVTYFYNVKMRDVFLRNSCILILLECIYTAYHYRELLSAPEMADQKNKNLT